MKTYSELISLPTYLERLKYLKVVGYVGNTTFGGSRYLNQILYTTPEWRRFRKEIIIRDNGCDLAHEDYPINGSIIVHHLNPITKNDILNRQEVLFDPENVICVSHFTHNRIHYGNGDEIKEDLIERVPNDTCPWR